ncbi:MAG: MBL fold metallo-hydrolase [Candidatus Micrarchaeota archaeon]
METNYNGIGISHPGHASFTLTHAGKTLYIDPFVFSEHPKEADAVLVTHNHYDHLGDISKIKKENTIIIGPVHCKGTTRTISSGGVVDLVWARVEAVPAYNINKKFHPRENGGIGYIIELNQTRIYHAGDTDNIPEMESYKADVAFLPIGGTYTMNIPEAIEAALKLNPKIVIPMHYNYIKGTEANPEEFKKELEKRSSNTIEVRII